MAGKGTIGYVAGEGEHWLYKAGSALTAKMSLQALNGGEMLTKPLTGFLASFGPSIGSLTALGILTATSAAIVQIDYRHAINKIIDTYRDEIAAKLKKPGHAIVEKDLVILARGDASRGIAANKVIAQELYKARAERTLGVGLAVGASLVTIATMGVLMSSGILAPVLAPLAFVPMGMGEALGEGLIGVGMYFALKKGLEVVGHKMFGLSHKTAHDHIEHLKITKADGKTITREQVLEVFAGVDTKLDQYIASTYGAGFSKLDAVTRQRATQDTRIAQTLAHITGDLNNGTLKVGELAFAANEQIFRLDAPEPVVRSAPVEYDNPTPKKSFVERFHEQQAQRQQPSQTIH